MAGETPERDDKLGSAIEEAQRKAQEDQRWQAHLELHELAAKLRYEDVQLRWDSHKDVHEKQDGSVSVALDAVSREQKTHAIAHDAAHAAHEREHGLVAKAASDQVISHEREHSLHDTAHDREHRAQEQAVGKVESTTEKRFEGVNEFRDQLRDQAATFASASRVDQMQKDIDRRFDEQRLAITNLEKGDVKSEGKGLGQSATVAIIVGAITLVGTILGIVIVIANFLSAG